LKKTHRPKPPPSFLHVDRSRKITVDKKGGKKVKETARADKLELTSYISQRIMDGTEKRVFCAPQAEGEKGVVRPPWNG